VDCLYNNIIYISAHVYNLSVISATLKFLSLSVKSVLKLDFFPDPFKSYTSATSALRKYFFQISSLDYATKECTSAVNILIKVFVHDNSVINRD